MLEEAREAAGHALGRGEDFRQLGCRGTLGVAGLGIRARAEQDRGDARVNDHGRPHQWCCAPQVAARETAEAAPSQMITHAQQRDDEPEPCAPFRVEAAVRRDASLQQHAHNSRPGTTHGRQVQRIPLLDSARARRALGEEEPDGHGAVVHGRNLERRHRQLVPRVKIGPALEQKPRLLHASPEASHVERSEADGIARLKIRSKLDEQLQRSEMPGLRSDVGGGLPPQHPKAREVPRFHAGNVGASTDQVPHGGDIAHVRRQEQGPCSMSSLRRSLQTHQAQEGRRGIGILRPILLVPEARQVRRQAVQHALRPRHQAYVRAHVAGVDEGA
mmetsp:Transcript_66626/g.192969  ORF Transcript_66626/g.192969 Transcript_66626/m.192969 type:complete len:331 (-) Transcript_66626:28-1020(-)